MGALGGAFTAPPQKPNTPLSAHRASGFDCMGLVLGFDCVGLILPSPHFKWWIHLCMIVTFWISVKEPINPLTSPRWKEAPRDSLPNLFPLCLKHKRSYGHQKSNIGRTPEWRNGNWRLFVATRRVFWALSSSKMHLRSGLCPEPAGEQGA